MSAAAVPPSTRMVGRRLPDGPAQGLHMRAGDYMRTSNGRLAVVLPNGAFGILTPEKWSWIEEDDGTLTVSPSIWDQSERGWHGWLRMGIWEAVDHDVGEQPDGLVA